MKYSEHGKKLLAWCSEDKLEMEMGKKNISPSFIGFCGKIRLSSCWNRFELDFFLLCWNILIIPLGRCRILIFINQNTDKWESNYWKTLILPQYLKLYTLNQPGNVISVHSNFTASKICDMTDKPRSTKWKHSLFKSLSRCTLKTRRQQTPWLKCSLYRDCLL